MAGWIQSRLRAARRVSGPARGQPADPHRPRVETPCPRRRAGDAVHAAMSWNGGGEGIAVALRRRTTGARRVPRPIIGDRGRSLDLEVKTYSGKPSDAQVEYDNGPTSAAWRTWWSDRSTKPLLALNEYLRISDAKNTQRKKNDGSDGRGHPAERLDRSRPGEVGTLPCRQSGRRRAQCFAGRRQAAGRDRRRLGLVELVQAKLRPADPVGLVPSTVPGGLAPMPGRRKYRVDEEEQWVK